MMADDEIEKLDPETEYLMLKRRTGNEWEMFKENVRPLKRGRNINLLNTALNAHNHNRLKKSLLDNRRRLIEAIDEYKGDDPLLPWLESIKWVQESFPPGGDCSGLVVIYEQCVRTFWHSELYKDDLRYLKVWLEYADNCIDADVIFSFLDANGIGRTHSTLYISYALYMESKNKIKAANEIFDLGISRHGTLTLFRLLRVVIVPFLFFRYDVAQAFVLVIYTNLKTGCGERSYLESLVCAYLANISVFVALAFGVCVSMLNWLLCVRGQRWSVFTLG